MVILPGNGKFTPDLGGVPVILPHENLIENNNIEESSKNNQLVDTFLIASLVQALVAMGGVLLLEKKVRETLTGFCFQVSLPAQLLMAKSFAYSFGILSAIMFAIFLTKRFPHLHLIKLFFKYSLGFLVLSVLGFLPILYLNPDTSLTMKITSTLMLLLIIFAFYQLRIKLSHYNFVILTFQIVFHFLIMIVAVSGYLDIYQICITCF